MRPRYARTLSRSPQRYTLWVSMTMSRWRVVSQLAAIEAAQVVDELDDICPLNVGFGAMLYRLQLDRATRAIHHRYQIQHTHAGHFWCERSV